MAASAMRRNAIFKRVGRIFPASDAVLGWHQASAWWGWTPSAAVAAVAAVAATSVVQTDGSSCDAALAGDAVAAELDAELLEALRAAVGEEHVSIAIEDRIDHGRDKYSHHHGPPPAAVVSPGSTEEVAAVLRILHDARVPVVAYGSGTSLEGHTVPQAHGVTMSTHRMDAVLALDVASADVRVQAGMRKDDLNELLLPHGLFFPVDPGPGASIGGMCATGCSGTNAVRFGTMKDNVLSLTAVLADGTVVSTGQRARKSSAGFDLTRLLIGSEGCLGVITEATLRLRPVPARTAVATASFASVHDAASAVIEILQRGVDVRCVELMDDTMVRVVNSQSGFSLPERPTLLFKFAGTEAEVAECARRTAEVISRHSAHGWEWTDEEAEMARIWQARKVALWSAQAAHPDMEVAITDVCVPVSRLAQAVSETKADIDASKLAGRAPIVGHVGDGNFHCFLTFNASNADEVAEAGRLNDAMVRRAIRLGGTCTGEHGIGLGKRQYVQTELGAGAVHTMRLLKAALDPRNILNPGKVIPPP